MSNERELELSLGPDASIGATLAVPEKVAGIVLFAHGSGSSRHSERNRVVARALNAAGLATLLIDLLTADEEAVDRHTREYRFDIDRLAHRLGMSVNWIESQAELRSLRIGLFGASTGAGAALVTAADRHHSIAAVVSRGGRPDLAAAALTRVYAPTLLIVGERDTAVLELNRLALQHLNGTKRLDIVPGATHLFEEPGALEQVARLARDWFTRYLAPPAGS